MEMVTMNFPAEIMKLQVLTRDEEQLADLRRRSPEKVTPEKILRVYDELFFPEAPEDRPYTFGSIVLSMDGKMAYTDDPQGPLVAAKNLLDPEGGLCDFWILNVLRAYADGVIIGAGTIAAEPKMISNCFDPELVESRIRDLGKKTEAPMNVVVSFDGTDIPLEHGIFSTEGLKTAIGTSPEGGQYLKEHFGRPHRLYGPWTSKDQVDVTELCRAMEERPEEIPVILTGEGARPDSGVLLYVLRQLGILRLCIESPSYMWHLISRQAMDEMFINYSSVYVGGPIAPGGSTPFSVNDHPHSRILTLSVHRNQFFFTRQQLVYGLKEDQPVRDERTM